MTRKILIPGGKIDDSFLVEAAHGLGLYVISSGADTVAPAHKISDRYVPENYSNEKAILKIAEEEKINYMCSCANDLGMVTTSYVCEKLGLPGHDSYNTTLLLHKKDRFKKFAEEIGLSTPIAHGFTDRKAAIDFLLENGISQKMIIKPVDGCSGMGITEIDNLAEIETAVDSAFAGSYIGHIVIEPFIEGQLHSASCFLVEQKVVFCFIEEGFGKPTNPHAMMAAISPAKDKGKIEKKLIGEVEKVAEKLQLVDGKIHMNFIVDSQNAVHILEMHRRCSGDTYSKFIEYSTGIKWNEWIVKAEMGLDVSDFPKDVEQKGFHMYFVITPQSNGVFQSFEIDSNIKKYVVAEFAVADSGIIVKDCRKDALGLVHLALPDYDTMRNVAENLSGLCKVNIAN